MRRVLLCLLFTMMMSALVVVEALPQTLVVAVDINKGKVEVSHTLGSGGIPTHINLLCDKLNGSTWTAITPYKITYPGPPPDSTTPVLMYAMVAAVIGTNGQGDYRCVANAENKVGVSPNTTPPFPFYAGLTPSPVTTIKILLQ